MSVAPRKIAPTSVRGTEEVNDLGYAERSRDGLEVLALGPFADQQQPHVNARRRGSRPRQGLNEHVEAFSRNQRTHSGKHEVARPHAQRGAECRGITLEQAFRIDRVVDDRRPFARQTVLEKSGQRCASHPHDVSDLMGPGVATLLL